MAEAQAYYRFIVLGEPGVGMTAFFLRIKYGEFIDPCNTMKSRSCREQAVFKTVINDTRLKVHLDEPAGSERFRSITTSFYRNTDAVILMYSVEDTYTFDGLEYIANVAKENLDQDRQITWALFGNKADLPLKIDNHEERVDSLLEHLGSSKELHHLVSAKTGENSMEALAKVAEWVHKRQGDSRIIPTDVIRINHASSAKSNEKACCK